ncbi:M3 family metallopeptidase [Elusimicrobiota bacterium]
MRYTMRVRSRFNGPATDNSDEYPAIDSPVLKRDLRRVSAMLDAIEKKARPLDSYLMSRKRGPKPSSRLISTARALTLELERCDDILSRLWSFAYFEGCIDGGNEKAKNLQATVLKGYSRHGKEKLTLAAFLRAADAETVKNYLAAPALRPYRSWVRGLRRRAGEALPLREEKLIEALGKNGIWSWARLHQSLPAKLKYVVPAKGGREKTLSARELTAMRTDDDITVRRAADDAIDRAWLKHEDLCCAILNALTGQNIEVQRLRSKGGKLDLLSGRLRENGVTRKTIDTLMSAVRAFRPKARRVLERQVRAFGQRRLHPWDYPFPVPKMAGEAKRVISFDESIEIVRKGYSAIHPDLGRYVDHMVRNRRIDAQEGERRYPCNYCFFPTVSDVPRVFYNLCGLIYDANGLAHELGHGYHLQISRGVPKPERRTSYVFSEAIATFMEMAVREELWAGASSPQERLRTAWLDMMGVGLDLMQNPAMFETELEIYERRKTEEWSVQGLKDMERRIFDDWHGKLLSRGSETAWLRSAILYKAGLGFHAISYTFGYLFSMGLWAQRERLGDRFFPAFVKLLRDSARMDIEPLVKKHLGQDLTRPGFWNAALRMVEARISRFERALAASISG